MERKYYKAKGSITFSGKVHIAENKGTSLNRAQRNVVVSLANKLRTQLDGLFNWTKWRSLSHPVRNELLDMILSRLVWNYSGDDDKTHMLTSAENFVDLWKQATENEDRGLA